MAVSNINILGVQVQSWHVVDLLEKILAIIKSNQKALVLNVNINCLNLAYENPWFLSFLNSAEIVFCDGAGVILGARILGFSIIQRITYADWMWELAGFSEQHNLSLFFLGGKPGIADIAAQRLRIAHPNINIVGTRHGYFDKQYGSEENEGIIRDINASKPNILLVTFGMPLQEHWLMENWDKVDANIALTGGAALDYVSGELKRAPRWMTDHGFEWLGRLIIDPQRLWKRYLIGNPLFFYRIFLQKISNKRVK